MRKFKKELVIDYAEKLLIGLDENEINMVLNEFEEIDKNINLINQIENISNVEPMTHTLDNFYYELDEDEIEESLEIDDILKNCSNHISNEVRVRKVVK